MDVCANFLEEIDQEASRNQEHLVATGEHTGPSLSLTPARQHLSVMELSCPTSVLKAASDLAGMLEAWNTRSIIQWDDLQASRAKFVQAAREDL